MTGAKLTDSPGSAALERGPSRVGPAHLTWPPWPYLAVGIVFLVWAFVCLRLEGLLLHYAVRHSPGRASGFVNFLSEYASAFWLAPHLAILATLSLMLVWFQLRSWERALAFITALWSAVALLAFLGLWAAFFRPPAGRDADRLCIECIFAISAMLLSLVCSIWYASERSRKALVLFVCLPLTQLAALVFMVQAELAKFHWVPPSFYPSRVSLLCIVAATAFFAFLIWAVARRYGYGRSAGPAYWALGILVNCALLWNLCTATDQFWYPLRIGFFAGELWGWLVGTVCILMAFEIVLLLAVERAWRRRSRDPAG